MPYRTLALLNEDREHSWFKKLIKNDQHRYLVSLFGVISTTLFFFIIGFAFAKTYLKYNNYMAGITGAFAILIIPLVVYLIATFTYLGHKFINDLVEGISDWLSKTFLEK